MSGAVWAVANDDDELNEFQSHFFLDGKSKLIELTWGARYEITFFVFNYIHLATQQHTKCTRIRPLITYRDFSVVWMEGNVMWVKRNLKNDEWN